MMGSFLFVMCNAESIAMLQYHMLTCYDFKGVFVYNESSISLSGTAHTWAGLSVPCDLQGESRDSETR